MTLAKCCVHSYKPYYYFTVLRVVHVLRLCVKNYQLNYQLLLHFIILRNMNQLLKGEFFLCYATCAQKLIPTDHIYIHKYRKFLSFDMFLNPYMKFKLEVCWLNELHNNAKIRRFWVIRQNVLRFRTLFIENMWHRKDSPLNNLITSAKFLWGDS